MIQTLLRGEERLVGRKSNRGGSRPGAGRPKSERDDIAVKLDRTLVARAHYVARLRGLTLAEYLTEAARPIVDRDFARESKTLEGAEGEGNSVVRNECLRDPTS